MRDIIKNPLSGGTQILAPRCIKLTGWPVLFCVCFWIRSKGASIKFFHRAAGRWRNLSERCKGITACGYPSAAWGCALSGVVIPSLTSICSPKLYWLQSREAIREKKLTSIAFEIFSHFQRKQIKSDFKSLRSSDPRIGECLSMRSDLLKERGDHWGDCPTVCFVCTFGHMYRLLVTVKEQPISESWSNLSRLGRDPATQMNYHEGTSVASIGRST